MADIGDTVPTKYEFVVYYNGRVLSKKNTQEEAHRFADARAEKIAMPSYNVDVIPPAEQFVIEMRSKESKEVVATEIYTTHIVLRR